MTVENLEGDEALDNEKNMKNGYEEEPGKFEDIDESELEEFIEPVCVNCTYFFQDQDTEDGENGNFGVCMADPDFEPYGEEICETLSFSCCYDLYQKKRFDGDREGCEDFELPECMDYDTYLEIERKRNANVSEVVKYLYDQDKELALRAFNTLEPYIVLGNTRALEGLIKFYESIGPAENIEDVHFRVKVVKLLNGYNDDTRIVEAFVNELKRSPSNNTTNQLYRLILDSLKKCDRDFVFDLLLQLLKEKKFSPKMKSKIMEVAEGFDDFDEQVFFI